MLNKPVLVDSGPLLAFYNDRDTHHTACRNVMETLPVGKAYTCWPVVVEVAYMLRGRDEQRDDFLQSLRDGAFTLFQIRPGELDAVRDVFIKYHDQEIDLADACLLHLAEREKIDTIFTLDRRHFSILRRQDGTALSMLPEVK